MKSTDRHYGCIRQETLNALTGAACPGPASYLDDSLERVLRHR